jgi:hypothetical protein
VILGEGLEEIGEAAFGECISLHEIFIPPAVTVIEDSAFQSCSSLTSVVFCDEIEEFVSREAMWDWWHRGLHAMSPSTYCFFSQMQHPKSFGFPCINRMADQH